MKNKYKFRMSRIMKILFATLLLTAISTSLYVSIFTMTQTANREVEKEQTILEKNVDLWDRNIKYELSFMYNYLTLNENVSKLNIAQSENDEFYAIQQIQFDLKEFSTLHYGMSEIFFFNSTAKNNGYVSANIKDYNNSTYARDRNLFLIDYCIKEETLNRWIIKEYEGKNYLFIVLNKNNNYIGCVSSIDYLLEDLINEDADSPSGNLLFITDKEGLTKSEPTLNILNFDFEAENTKDSETGTEYRQIIQNSECVPICFVELIDKNVLNSVIYYVSSRIIIISIALTVFIFIWSRLFDRTIYRPLKVLMKHMGLLSSGDQDTRIHEKSNVYETSLLYNTFNNMAQELQTLNTALYKNEMLIHKTNIEYIKLQIHPHFLVNGINSVSTMIDMNKNEAAKEMCAYLADYYRYQFQHTDGLIPLEDELRQVELYMNIQQMRRPGKISYCCETDESCSLIKIPPVSILTFVGNCIKYGMNPQTFRTDISVKIRKTSEGMRIIIRDTGSGFSDNILQHLKDHRPIYQKGRECIGMQNAMIRLYLFYDGSATCDTYNDNGAVVEINIPDIK